MNLIDRELKLFFTSPLLLSLEFIPSALIALLVYYKWFESIVAIAWVVIVTYSTFFELEVWRKTFLNKGFKLKLYVNSSQYKPFLAHTLVSLILLEPKTLIVLMPLIIKHESLNFWFLLGTHGYWLFSLSASHILSKEVFRSLNDSIVVFLFSMTTIIAMISTSSQFPYWPIVSPIQGRSEPMPGDLFLPFLSIPLYIFSLYACLLVARNIRIDDI